MANVSEVMQGLQVISKYSDDICAEHDCIYAGPGVKVSKDDQAKLEELGWHWDNEAGSWARFV